MFPIDLTPLVFCPKSNFKSGQATLAMKKILTSFGIWQRGQRISSLNSRISLNLRKVHSCVDMFWVKPSLVLIIDKLPHLRILISFFGNLSNNRTFWQPASTVKTKFKLVASTTVKEELQLITHIFFS